MNRTSYRASRLAPQGTSSSCYPSYVEFDWTAMRNSLTPQFNFFSKKEGIAMAQHEAVEHHNKAAEHHENAAAHHRQAGEHHEQGEHEKAAHHAHVANGHGLHAAHHAAEATKHHADEHGGPLDEEQEEEQE
jgi:hypothetical protein